MELSEKPSPFQIWLMAIRPKTLVAAIVPVLLGAATAKRVTEIDGLILFFILASALCIQIGTNLANDYSDFKSGADTHKRLGPVRVTQAGLMEPAQVKNAAIIFFAMAFLLGIPLIIKGGWLILLIGLISILCGWAYTGGPYPLGYHGLGEFFVFIFFGLISVTVTTYLLTDEWSFLSLLVSVCPGLFSSALIAVNNIRDIETDREAGKMTLAACFGRKFGRVMYLFMMLIPFLIPFVLFLIFKMSWIILLPVLILPLCVQAIKIVFTKTDGPSMIQALGATARVNLLFGILLCIGLIL